MKAWPLRTLAATSRTTLLFVTASVLGLMFLEAAARLSRLDHRLAARAMYLLVTDPPVHRISNDPFLHFELAPGARFEKQGQHGFAYIVHIDAFGAREPSHPRIKPPGTFRILCFGGSTMYGYNVNDDQTIAARLEVRLDHRSRPDNRTPVAVEVWNFGTSAYTLGQAAHLAKRKLFELDPDLIVVQHHNIGRRPFLAENTRPGDGVSQNAAVSDHPEELENLDCGFFEEQFPIPHVLPNAWHCAGVTGSALYRSLIALSAHFFLESPDHPRCDRCNEISRAEASALSREAEARGIPVVYVAIPVDEGRLRPSNIFPDLREDRFIDLYRPNEEPAFYDAHPPPAILDEFARVLADELGQRGLLLPRSR
jgi:hypothetical protein